MDFASFTPCQRFDALTLGKLSLPTKLDGLGHSLLPGPNEPQGDLLLSKYCLVGLRHDKFVDGMSSGQKYLTLRWKCNERKPINGIAEKEERKTLYRRRRRTNYTYRQ
jgi:hypothetical protein